MKIEELKSCYIGPLISPEEFIAEHFFLHLVKGSIHGFDGTKAYELIPEESCLVRKNHLARYNKQKTNNEFEKIIVIFDTHFLKQFLEKYPQIISRSSISDAFISIQTTKKITHYLNSLQSCFTKDGSIYPEHFDAKREELLFILLKNQPELVNILFYFGQPDKIDLEAFMVKNYKFNVSLARFAFLSGRSLSAFKRDFNQTFGETPNRWLVQKRLIEAHFLIEKKKKKPSEIYLDLGFEDLSHFSFAFKKAFGKAPTKLPELKP